MPKFLFRGSYSQQGIKGAMKEGGSKRRDAASALAESVAGRLETYYFAFGDRDFYAVADLPDNAAALLVAATVGASGAMGSFETVPLLTPEEADEVTKRSATYRPPSA